MQPPITPPGPEEPQYRPSQPPTRIPSGPPASGDIVGKTAISTVTVLAILFGLFCVLPVLGCAVLAMLGGIGR